MTQKPRFTSRFEEALVYAHRLHAGQVRKGALVPYISHLLAVAALVIENGGDEDEAIAALLHDAVEDQGGTPTLQAIRERFGERVGDIVEACTDAMGEPKPPWERRKRAFIARLAQANHAVRLVAAADKLHNARSILQDYRTLGEALWSRFTGGRKGTLWYYRALADTLSTAPPTPLANELARTVTELERLADGAPAQCKD